MRDGLVQVAPQSPPAAPLEAIPGFERPVAPLSHPLERALAVVRRYRWLILACTIVMAGLGAVASRFVKPKYEVRATVWLSDSKADERGPIRSAELLSAGAWIELFRSFHVVDEVVRTLSLYLKPADPADQPLFAGFALADRFLAGKYELDLDRDKKTWTLREAPRFVRTRPGKALQTGAESDSVGTKVGLRWVLPPQAFQGVGLRRVLFNLATPRETSVQVLKHLESKLQIGSNFLWLIYTDDDPRMATRTLNTWLAEYIHVAADLKKRNVVEFSHILEGQLRYAEKATQDAEVAYQQFRVHAITLPTDGGPTAPGLAGMFGGDPALSSYFEQKIQYDNLRHDREALEKSIANAASGSAPYEGLLLIPSVAQSPGAEALREAFRSLYQERAKLSVQRQQFTDEFLPVQQTRKGIDVLQTQTIPQLAGQLLSQLRERELDYEHRIQGQSRELQAIPPRTIEEMRLKRAVGVAEVLYTNLKSRFAEAQLAEAGASPDVSVLDTAIAPMSAATAPMSVFMMVAMLAGLAGAIGLSMLLDKLDRRVRYADHVTSDLNMMIAGAVPVIPKGGITGSSPEQVVQFVESFRALRMHVTHSLPSGRSVALAVSSPAPGDGKSIVSANLALSFAEAGLRTVLIDGDTRRGSLHRLFSLKMTGGLTDYLAGTCTAAEIIHRTNHENLSFVSRGRRHEHSPELIASDKLRRFVEQLTQSFDVVLIDTPPLAAGIDGFAISAAAGNVLLVVRVGQTERRLAAAKLAILDRLPVQVLGAVLNGVPLTGEFQYYAYSPGYSVDSGDIAGELASSAKG